MSCAPAGAASARLAHTRSDRFIFPPSNEAAIPPQGPPALPQTFNPPHERSGLAPALSCSILFISGCGALNESGRFQGITTEGYKTMRKTALALAAAPMALPTAAPALARPPRRAAAPRQPLARAGR